MKFILLAVLLLSSCSFVQNKVLSNKDAKKRTALKKEKQKKMIEFIKFRQIAKTRFIRKGMSQKEVEEIYGAPEDAVNYTSGLNYSYKLFDKEGKWIPYNIVFTNGLVSSFGVNFELIKKITAQQNQNRKLEIENAKARAMQDAAQAQKYRNYLIMQGN